MAGKRKLDNRLAGPISTFHGDDPREWLHTLIGLLRSQFEVAAKKQHLSRAGSPEMVEIERVDAARLGLDLCQRFERNLSREDYFQALIDLGLVTRVESLLHSFLLMRYVPKVLKAQAQLRWAASLPRTRSNPRREGALKRYDDLRGAYQSRKDSVIREMVCKEMGILHREILDRWIRWRAQKSCEGRGALTVSRTDDMLPSFDPDAALAELRRLAKLGSTS